MVRVSEKWTDEQFVAALQNGDSRYMGNLYNRYSNKVFHKCLSFLKDKDDAYDVSQDVLIKAFQNVHSFRGNSTFSTWLFSITCNHCLEYLRKKKKYQNVNTSHLNNAAYSPSSIEDAVDSEKKEAAIKAIVSSLPSDEQQLLRLKYEQNASIKDLQEKLQLSASCVKMRLMRARKKVLDLYTDYRLAS